MNEDFKSISQIASEIGVTRQAVYQKLKQSDLANSVKPFTVKQHNLTLYDLQAQELIKRAFESSVNGVNIDSKRQSTNGKLIDTLQASIEALTKQLEVKDNQIETLTETVKTLTANLAAAQALHGMDKQQATIAVTAAPKAEQTQRPRSEPRRQPQKKKSWLDKLLRR